MFLKHLEPIFKPFRNARTKVVKAKTVKGNFKAETKRVQRFGANAQKQAGQAGKLAKGAKGAGAKAKKPAIKGPKLPKAPKAPKAPKGPKLAAGQAPGKANKPAGQGAPPPGQANAQGVAMSEQPLPPDFNPNPPIALKGVFVRKKYCTQCEQQLDKSWDACPYCAQAYAEQQVSAPAEPAKTQMFNLNTMANPFAPPKISWLVAVQGPQRGELFTMQGSVKYVVGKAETCDVVLQGTFVSGKHMEFAPDGDYWRLRDLGSSNGTYVNDKRVMEQELLDNDMITIGDCVYKFKQFEL